MRIEVRLFANLADYLPLTAPRAGTSVELDDGTTVGDLCRSLGIPEDLPRLLLVNGQEVDPGHRLATGDVVSVLPPLVGGS